MTSFSYTKVDEMMYKMREKVFKFAGNMGFVLQGVVFVAKSPIWVK